MSKSQRQYYASSKDPREEDTREKVKDEGVGAVRTGQGLTPRKDEFVRAVSPMKRPATRVSTVGISPNRRREDNGANITNKETPADEEEGRGGVLLAVSREQRGAQLTSSTSPSPSPTPFLAPSASTSHSLSPPMKTLFVRERTTDIRPSPKEDGMSDNVKSRSNTESIKASEGEGKEKRKESGKRKERKEEKGRFVCWSERG